MNFQNVQAATEVFRTLLLMRLPPGATDEELREAWKSACLEAGRPEFIGELIVEDILRAWKTKNE